MIDRTGSDTEALIQKLPPHISDSLVKGEQDQTELLEIVLDLGRQPEARFLSRTIPLSIEEVAEKDIQHVIQRVGDFGSDNRAGIERTLHRISGIRNRNGKVVGLTLRFGRAVYGTVKIVEDLILTNKSTLLLGRPGVGKTTMLREVARVLADNAHKRVVVVDTSNEIAGDGDIPHPGIGTARRMQVPSPLQQHSVMIEAVENHMPEVIVIDEIGTELEATAARTIAERGVQLVATAHGNTLENLILNPTLSDLIGGVQAVILGDDEARRRRTQKTVQERRSPPTFDILVEIQGWDRVAIHDDVGEVVDRILRGFPVAPEIRTLGEDGHIEKKRSSRIGQQLEPSVTDIGHFNDPNTLSNRLDRTQLTVNSDLQGRDHSRVTNILPYGVNKGKLQQIIRSARAPIELVSEIEGADLLLTTKNYYRRRTHALKEAEEKGKPLYVLRKNTSPQIEQFVKAISRNRGSTRSQNERFEAVTEAEEAVAKISNGHHKVDLSPRGAYIRHLQHTIAEDNGVASSSTGVDPSRHVVIYRD